jgi:sortase (surface protein transpeptidase)
MFGKLLDVKAGDRVRFADIHSTDTFKVVKVRDRRDNPLLPNTYRRRNQVVRSTAYAVLYNLSAKRLRTVYGAENLNVLTVSD